MPVQRTSGLGDYSLLTDGGDIYKDQEAPKIVAESITCLVKKDRISSAKMWDEKLQKTIDKNGWTSLPPSLHGCQVRAMMPKWWTLISAKITKTVSAYKFCIENKPT